MPPPTNAPTSRPDEAGASAEDSLDPTSPPTPRAAPRSALAELIGASATSWSSVDRARALASRLRSSSRYERVLLVSLAVAAVSAVIVATIGLRASSSPAGAGGRGDPVLPMATRSPGTTPAAAAGAAGGRGATTTSVSGPLWVAVTGAVVRPGLFRVDAGARVAQLLSAAGGLSVDADGDRINLAAPVRDGERVHVPRRGEPAAPPVVAGTGGPAPGPGGSAPAGEASGPIDLNTASAEQLDGLPGVGPATATAIVDHRTRQGPFTSVDQLDDVRGIGPAKLEQLRSLVTV